MLVLVPWWSLKTRHHTGTCYFLYKVYVPLLPADWWRTWHILWDGVTTKFNERVPSKPVSESSRWFPGPLSSLRWGSTRSPLCSGAFTHCEKTPRCHCAQVQDFLPAPWKPKPPNAFKNNSTVEIRITSSNRDFNHKQQNNSVASTFLFKELRNLLSAPAASKLNVSN